MPARPEQPLRVHWAIALEEGRDEFVSLLTPIPVLQVGSPSNWPHIEAWYRFACEWTWLAERATLRGGEIVDGIGQTGWNFEWGAKCLATRVAIRNWPPGRT